MRLSTLAWLVIGSLLYAGCQQHSDERSHEEHGHDEHAEHGDAGAQPLDGATVRIASSAVSRSGIQLHEVQEARLIGGVTVPAEVQLNPNRTAHISPIVSGQLDEVRVSLGDRVETGQVLATMRSVALGEARSAASNARAAAELARANFRRQEELKREGIGSERAFLETQGALRRAEADLSAANERLQVYGGRKGSGSKTAIRSPQDGTVIERHATVGELVSGDEAIFVVSDLSKVWVLGRLYEQDVASARLGAPAVVSLQAYPRREWSGAVSYVASTLDPHTRTLAIRVELDNPEGILRPGLFGEISLRPTTEEADALPVIPEDALQRIEGQSVVFVAEDEVGLFRSRVVTLGARSRGKIEVREGLQKGDRVVVSGAFTLKSELLREQLSEHDH